MKKKVLIASFDLEVGGVERSLISMLDAFDYDRYEVDLLLYRHKGDFMDMLPERVNLLPEVPELTTFRKSVGETLREGQYRIGLSRLTAKWRAQVCGRINRLAEPGYLQLQYMWESILPRLPQMGQAYDAAISYLWPHDYVAGKVRAKTKIAWIHTDYGTVETEPVRDERMWSRFDHIVAVSDACREAFLSRYAGLAPKVTVMENILPVDLIRRQAKERIEASIEADPRFKLLTVARLSHAKGIDNAVRAMKLLHDRGYKDLVWYVVGYGGDEELVRRLIAESNLGENFVLLGKKLNPYPYMSACDVYVQPSRYEGKAVTVSEAQFLGKPIVVTNYPTAASQVRHGIDGYITEMSVEGIARGIERLYLDAELRERIGRRNRQANHENRSELQRLYRLIGEGEHVTQGKHRRAGL